MTTLENALRYARQMPLGMDFVEVSCRIICKRLHKGENSQCLSIVLCDEQGVVIEATTWGLVKARRLSRYFKNGQIVRFSCPSDVLEEPNKLFTQAECTANYYWDLRSGSHHFEQRGHVKCFADIEAFQKASRQAKMLAGVVVRSGIEGPKHHDRYGNLVAVGNFIELHDTRNQVFRVLVWDCITDDEDFHECRLPKINEGDCIVLINAREQNECYRDLCPIYTVTTCYPPVVFPTCCEAYIKDTLRAAPYYCPAINYNPHKYLQQNLYRPIGYSQTINMLLQEIQEVD